MTRPAGEYGYRLRRRVYTPTENDDNGQQVPAWVDGGYLWCAVEDVGGIREPHQGGTQTGAQCVIRVRNYPTLTAQDILYDSTADQKYVIETITYGSDELLVDARRMDNTELPEGN